MFVVVDGLRWPTRRRRCAAGCRRRGSWATWRWQPCGGSSSGHPVAEVRLNARGCARRAAAASAHRALVQYVRVSSARCRTTHTPWRGGPNEGRKRERRQRDRAVLKCLGVLPRRRRSSRPIAASIRPCAGVGVDVSPPQRAHLGPLSPVGCELHDQRGERRFTLARRSNDLATPIGTGFRVRRVLARRACVDVRRYPAPALRLVEHRHSSRTYSPLDCRVQPASTKRAVKRSRCSLGAASRRDPTPAERGTGRGPVVAQRRRLEPFELAWRSPPTMACF